MLTYSRFDGYTFGAPQGAAVLPEDDDETWTPPPAPPPDAESSKSTIQSLKDGATTVVSTAKEAIALGKDIKSIVDTGNAANNTPAAQAASTPAGNAGARDPAKLAALVTAFRQSISEFLADPSPATLTAMRNAFREALGAWALDRAGGGYPPQAVYDTINALGLAMKQASDNYQAVYEKYAGKVTQATLREQMAQDPAMRGRLAAAGIATAGGSSDSGGGGGGIAVAIGLALAVVAFR